MRNTTLLLQYAIPKEINGKYSKCERYGIIDSNLTSDNSTCTPDKFDTAVREKCTSFIYSDEDSAVKDVSMDNIKRKTIVIKVYVFSSLPILVSWPFGSIS